MIDPAHSECGHCRGFYHSIDEKAATVLNLQVPGAGASTGICSHFRHGRQLLQVELQEFPYEIIKIAAILAVLYYIGLGTMARSRRQSTTLKGCLVKIYLIS
jgi:hypothetical protein